MADPATAESEKAESDAQKRIKELDRRNKELEKLVNMKERIDKVESAVELAARNQENAGKAAHPPADTDGWDAFLDPKIAPAIERHIAPIKSAVLRMLDDNDHLRTLVNNPKYRDPEIQAEVESIRKQRLSQSGMLEPRENIITFLKGLHPEKFEDSSETVSRREEAGNIHIESNAGVGGPRAAGRTDARSVEDMSTEDVEKWMVENNYKIP